jgi:hypothetical protein
VPIDFAGPDHRFSRIDLEIDGIFHGEASYEGRIFFNHANADRNTPRSAENGYAGSFYIFGHGGCLGDAGHCEVNEDSREPYDFRPPHPLTPAVKQVTVTQPLQEIAKTNDANTPVPLLSVYPGRPDSRVTSSRNSPFLTDGVDYFLGIWTAEPGTGVPPGSGREIAIIAIGDVLEGSRIAVEFGVDEADRAGLRRIYSCN